MIIVTGGAGFIGSNLVISLQERGFSNVVICDDFGEGEKWQNLRKHGFSDIVSPENLFTYLVKHRDEVEIIFHLGDNSSTTETNVDALLKNNFAFSVNLWNWCARNEVRFIYASSATTYGDGEQGFEDNQSAFYLNSLKPLTAHAWTKHLFDLHASKVQEEGGEVPPRWAGLKIFNVYGPNEYHKEDQKSVLCQKFPRAKENLKIQLFRSQNPEFADGGQLRDFIYVKDCCDILIWMMENRLTNGLFNIGSGHLRSFNDMANCLYTSIGHPVANIDYVDMPPEIIDKYQYKTHANLTKLRSSGYVKETTSLEEGTQDYVQNYLMQSDQYR